MKKRVAISSLLVALLVACGSDSAKVYTITTGTYAVSNATASTADQCGLLDAYTAADKVIGITVADTTATFNLANDPSAALASLPTATINGNALELLAEANYTTAVEGTSCVYRMHKSVTGSITADDETELTLTFDADTESGATCVVEDTPFAALPCASTYHFAAKKQ